MLYIKVQGLAYLYGHKDTGAGESICLWEIIMCCCEVLLPWFLHVIELCLVSELLELANVVTGLFFDMWKIVQFFTLNSFHSVISLGKIVDNLCLLWEWISHLFFSYPKVLKLMPIHCVGVPFFSSPISVLLILDEIQAMDQISTYSLWSLLSSPIYLRSSQCHRDESMTAGKYFSEESLYVHSTYAFPKLENL